MDIIKKYFPEIGIAKLNTLENLKSIYSNWNEQINVISRKDFDNFYERHVLHSLSISKIIQFLPNTKILDVGTGGGFPGIPLAIIFPKTDFTLVDSIGKKIKVVNAVAEEINLSNVTPLHKRADQVNDNFDFVISRAVTKFNSFVPWVKDKIIKQSNHHLKNGILALKGGDIQDELNKVKFYKSPTIFPISNFFKEEFYTTKLIVHIPL